MKRSTSDIIHCSFCGRASNEVANMIAGPNVYICDICIHSSVEILKATTAAAAATNKTGAATRSFLEKPLPKPSAIKQALDEYVIGQDIAKQTLSVAVYNHYKRLRAKGTFRSFDEVEIDKSNVLLLGPTGTGKTLLAQTLARVLDVPFVIADATTLTEAGYVGDDVETILALLLQNADYDVERAEMGIIYLDEIDKITRKSDSPSITRDVSGEGVQQALLKILEGTSAGVPPKGGRKHPEQPLVNVNTKNILFICGGAFDGLERIISRRLGKRAIGFTASETTLVTEDASLFAHVEPEDLIKFGFIPEFIGRLPIITALEPLTDEALISILTEPKNAIVKQYQKLFMMEGAELEFTTDALQAVVQRAKELKTGARGLRGILENIMTPTMFSLPDQTDIERCEITAETIAGGPPVIHKKNTSSRKKVS